MLNRIKRHLKPHILRACTFVGQHKLPSRSPRLWILMYHRILPKDDERFALEEPGMLVTPTSFSMHLEIIKKYFEPVALGDWLEARAAGRSLPAKACAVTFDDGWRDNFEYALPILEHHQIPACIFAVSHNIGTDQRFWPNQLAELFHHYYPGNRNKLAELLHWVPGVDAILLKQSAAPDILFELINRCKHLSDADIYQYLQTMDQKYSPGQNKPDLMDWSQLKQLAEHPLIEIGSHTCHHFRLNSQLDTTIVDREVIESKQLLESTLNKPIRLFCYPNGDYTQRVAELVAEHYAGAVTTNKGINSSIAEPHTLLRIGVHEDISSTATSFEARLSGWV